MPVACPQCRNPIELAQDASEGEIICPSCGSSFPLERDATLPWSTPGERRLGKFALLEPVGSGAFGTVYKARDTVLGRLVAVKVPRAGHLSTEEERGRFLREARSVAQLRHPAIVPVHEVGEVDGQPYLVSEFVEGLTLSDLLSGRPPTSREAAEIIAVMAEALQYAHEQGVVHRDVKPSNILIDAEGRPHLMDFGLARRDAGEVTMTIDGQVLGTPAYMSPEQARGEGHKVDGRSDVYSLGVVLYLLLTGELPFRGNTRMLLHQVLHDEPKPPRRLDDRIPRDLETVCLKAMAKEPERRYATAGELAAELRRFLKGEPIEARPVGQMERLSRWCRRNPAMASLLATLIVVLFGVTVASLLVAAHFEHTAANERSARAAADTAFRQAEHARRARERTLTDVYTASGLAAGARGDPRQAVLWFADAARLAGDDRVRAAANRIRVAAWGRQSVLPSGAFSHPAEWIERLEVHPGGRHLLSRGYHEATGETDCRLWDLEREAELPFPGGPAVVSAAAWDASGGELAVGTLHGGVTISRFPGGDLLHRVPAAGHVSHLLFSPDGHYCAVAAGDRVRVWDCRQAAFATPELKHPGPVTTLAFHPQGELLATGCADHSCRVFPVPGESGDPLFAPIRHFQEPLRVVGQQPVPPLFVDGGRGLLIQSRSVLTWHDARTGESLHSLSFGSGSATSIDVTELSSDGKVLVVSGLSDGKGHAQLYLLPSTRSAYPGMDHRRAQYVLAAAFSPDGGTVLTGSSDRSARLWSVPDGRPLGGPLTHPASVAAVAFTPDGRHVVTAERGGTIHLWTLPDAPPDATLSIGATSLVRLSRDGRFVLPSGRTSKACTVRRTRVFDLRTGQPVGQSLVADGLIMDAVLSPDGRRVAAAVSRAATPAERRAPTGSLAGRLLIWDPLTGGAVHEPLPLPSEPRSLDYSPDGRRLGVVCAQGQVVLVDSDTGKTAMEWQAHPPSPENNHYVNNGALRFAPDGHSVLTFGTQTNSVRVWDCRDGTLRRELKHQGKCHDVQFSPDGRLVTTAAFDNRVCVWEFETGRKLATLDHPDWAFASTFSPDERHLLTACRDGTARMWDWQAGTIVCAPFEHDHEVHAVAFTPDGRNVLSAGDDGRLKVWEWVTGKEVCPPVQLGGPVFSLGVSPDGRRVAVGGNLIELRVVHLDARLSPPILETDDLCLWAEVVSGQRLDAGGGVINLTANEWLDRRRDFRRRHPAVRPGPAPR